MKKEFKIFNNPSSKKHNRDALIKVKKKHNIQYKKKQFKDKRSIKSLSWSWHLVKRSLLFKTFLISEYNKRFKIYLYRSFKKANVVASRLVEKTKSRLSKPISYLNGVHASKVRRTLPIQLSTSKITVTESFQLPSLLLKKYNSLHRWRSKFGAKRIVNKNRRVTHFKKKKERTI